jgi:protoporphyrinogen oxidase
MAWLWARIHARANTRDSGGRREQLGYFRGGFATVIRRLESELVRSGVEIRKGVGVEAFMEGERAVKTKTEEIGFDVCIFTGPSPAFARLLPPGFQESEYAQRLRSIEYLGAISLVFVTDQEISDCYWLNINEPKAPFLVFLNHTRLVEASHYQGKRVYYIGAYAALESRLFSLNDEDLAKLWWDYLKKIFPHFSPAQVQQRHVFRFQAAQHIVDTTYEKKIPDYRTPLPGVFLSNFSQIFPHDRGTTWAVNEGIKIARTLQ